MTSKQWVSVIAWCVYDWAASSFPIIVTTFIFATYFTTTIAVNKTLGTYQWANATAIAGAIIAVFSPLFGAIADYSGHHLKWLLCLTALCIMSTASLWFDYPAVSATYFTLTAVVIGTIGFEVSMVFYNAYLPQIVPKSHVGRLSGIEWGTGYLGGIVALSIVFVLFFKFPPHWLSTQHSAQIRICGPFVALWFALFSLPLFFLAPNIDSKTLPISRAVRSGWTELMSTLKKLPQEKNILLYLIAHMIYTDGLNTLFAFGGIYAANTYHLTFQEVLLFGITMNITAGIGAILLGWLDDFMGSKQTILISLICLTGLGIPVIFLHSKWLFWISSLFLSLFVGPTQSARRSLMVHLIRKQATSTEMFGLYALSGRVTAFLGPWILGSMTLLFNSQRVGMLTVLIFFIIGGLLLLPVKSKTTH